MLSSREECAACREHETGECDKHYEEMAVRMASSGRCVVDDDEFGDRGGMPNVCVDRTWRF